MNSDLIGKRFHLGDLSGSPAGTDLRVDRKSVFEFAAKRTGMTVLEITAASIDPRRGEQTIEEIRAYCEHAKKTAPAKQILLQMAHADEDLQTEIDGIKDLMAAIHADPSVPPFRRTRWVDFLGAYRMRLKRSQRGAVIQQIYRGGN